MIFWMHLIRRILPTQLYCLAVEKSIEVRLKFTIFWYQELRKLLLNAWRIAWVFILMNLYTNHLESIFFPRNILSLLRCKSKWRVSRCRCEEILLCFQDNTTRQQPRGPWGRLKIISVSVPWTSVNSRWRPQRVGNLQDFYHLFYTRDLTARQLRWRIFFTTPNAILWNQKFRHFTWLRPSTWGTFQVVCKILQLLSIQLREKQWCPNSGKVLFKQDC